MIDVYAIGTTLKLTDRVTPELVKLTREFSKLDALALQVNKRLQKMGAEVVGVRNLASAAGRLAGSLKSITNQSALAERNLASLRAALPGGGLGLEAELIAANAQARTLAATLAGIRGARLVPSLPGGGGGSGGRGGHRGRLHGGNLHVGPHGFGIGGVGMGLASDMLVPLAAAGMAAYVGHKFYESAKDYEMAYARFRSLNLGDKLNEDADKFARSTRQFGVSMTERMTMLRDMHEVMGSYEEAKAVTPLFSRMLAANKGVFGEEGNRFDEKTFQALGKVIEMRGGTASEAEMFRQADFAQKVLTGSAGLVTPTDMLAFMKTGGVAARLLSNRAFYEESAPMIQEMGGTRFGTSIMSAHQNLAMGRGSLQAMKEATRLGIIDPKMIEYTSIGTIKRVLPGALKAADLFNTSKFEYLLSVLVPAIRQQGVLGPGHKLVTGNAITDDQIVSELNLLFSQRTAANAFAQMYLQRNKIEKNVGVTDKAMGIKELEDVYKKSPAGAEAEFTAAWTDFKTQFGKSLLPAITNMLKVGADMLRGISDFANSPAGKTISEIGGGALHAFAWPYRLLFGDAEAAEPKKDATVVSPSRNSSGIVHTTLNIDGKKFASATAPYFAGPLGSGLHIGNIDNDLALPMPALK